MQPAAAASSSPQTSSTKSYVDGNLVTPLLHQVFDTVVQAGNYACTQVRDYHHNVQARAIQTKNVSDFENQLKQEELAFDPFYGFIRFAIAGLIYSKEKILQQKAIETDKSKEYPKVGLKVSVFKYKIYITLAGIYQTVVRSLPLMGSDRTELLLLQKPIVKGLKWFSPHKFPDMAIIYRAALMGLEALHETYGPDSQGHEKDFTGRGVRSDVSLIQKYTESNAEKFTSDIAEIDQKLFPLKDQKLTQDETRDEFLHNQVHAKWDAQIKIIANSLELAQNHLDMLQITDDKEEIKEYSSAFDTEIDSLRQRIRTAPENFMRILEKIDGLNQALIGKIKAKTATITDEELLKIGNA
jgi:hypothetical protein